MKKNGILKHTGFFVLDFFEIYLPTATFTVMFSVFVLQIFFRYVLNKPLIWPYEVSIFAFIWTALLGACFAQRHRIHVVFGLFYDRQKARTQLYFRLAGNLLIFVAFVIAFLPTLDFINFMKIDKSTALKIPFNIAFGPYLIFMILIAGRIAYDLVLDLKKLVKGDS